MIMLCINSNHAKSHPIHKLLLRRFTVTLIAQPYPIAPLACSVLQFLLALSQIKRSLKKKKKNNVSILMLSGCPFISCINACDFSKLIFFLAVYLVKLLAFIKIYISIELSFYNNQPLTLKQDRSNILLQGTTTLKITHKRIIQRKFATVSTGSSCIAWMLNEISATVTYPSFTHASVNFKYRHSNGKKTCLIVLSCAQ